jgi:hypothetical protein
MLLSYLPKLSSEAKKYVWAFLTPTIACTLAALLFNCPLWAEAILNIIIYPCLIYFSFQTEFYFAVFNYLGSLSFGLYAFQSIARCATLWGVTNLWLLFIIILIPTLIESAVKLILAHNKKMKKHLLTTN